MMDRVYEGIYMKGESISHCFSVIQTSKNDTIRYYSEGTINHIAIMVKEKTEE